MSNIPKVIHYCWFGKSELPLEAKKCIESWKLNLPNYQIKRWDEDNFDLTCCQYVSEAYRKKKWAFVSDYARFWILYNYGGVYFDTDVEVIKNMNDLINKGSFMGEEYIDRNNECIGINPGLGIAAESGLDIYKEILDFYSRIHFIDNNGRMNQMTVVEYVTDIMKKHGLEMSKKIQNIDNIFVYPPEYFGAYNYITKELIMTENTYSIHHYAATWLSKLDKLIIKIETCNNESGDYYRWRRIISFPLRKINKIYKDGLINTIIELVKGIVN